ncbi:MAG: hypothetical protein M3N98_08770 [Actinomycetota bacterium]|nr:hypothetical protein [Actinomycetota bacterium]
MAQTAPRPSPSQRDWTEEAADRIEAVVVAVRDKTTVPIQKVARAVVYGLVAGVLGATALVLLVVAVFRLHVYLPFHPEARRVWVSYLGTGAIFLVVGLLLWHKRTPRAKG